MPFFQGNRGTSSEIWGTEEHKILCANDIKYCYKEPFFRRDTEWDGISDISACLVCFDGCFNGPYFKTQIRKTFALSISHLGTCICFPIIFMFRSGISVSFQYFGFVKLRRSGRKSQTSI